MKYLTLLFLVLAVIALWLSNFGAACAGFIGYVISGAAWMWQETKDAPIVK